MAKQTIDGKWICSICKKEFPRDIDAVAHEKKHEIIYVPLSRDDLFKLVQFLFSVRDESLLTPSLIKTLKKYTKGNYR